MSSLDRLIKLAQKTGDRLIVHNPYENQDVVIMGVDEYERLALGKKDVRELSSGQLLDQINRDIAIWRSNKEMEDSFYNEEILEDEMEKAGPFDPFCETDSHLPEWHSTGSVIDERLKDFKSKKFNDFDLNDEDPLDVVEDEEKIEVGDIPNFGEDEKVEEEKIENIMLKTDSGVEEKKDESIRQTQDEVRNVPLATHSEEVWKEEPLAGEDPIFYEEPV